MGTKSHTLNYFRERVALAERGVPVELCLQESTYTDLVLAVALEIFKIDKISEVDAIVMSYAEMHLRTLETRGLLLVSLREFNAV